MMAYLATILLHSLHIENKSYEVALWIFVVYFCFEKALQIFAGGIKLFMNDSWNVVDVVMIFFITYYLLHQKIRVDERQGEEVQTDDDYDPYKLLGFTNMISWIRGLTYLRSFESTRIFIFLVVKMIKQLKAFISVMVGGILCFSTTYFILNQDTFKNGEGGLESLWSSFLLTLGEFDLDNMGPFEKAIFVIESFLMTIILLNLIIALMSDTYEEVMTNIVQLDGRQLNSIIIQCENFLFFNRGRGTSQFLFKCEYSQEVSGKWKSALDHVTNLLESTKKAIDQQQEVVLKNISEQKIKTENLQRLMEIRFNEIRKRQENSVANQKSEMQLLTEKLDKLLEK